MVDAMGKNLRDPTSKSYSSETPAIDFRDATSPAAFSKALATPNGTAIGDRSCNGVISPSREPVRFDTSGNARDKSCVSHPLACDVGARAFAAVALVPAIPGKDLLTYQVAEADRVRIRPGVRVLVPIGRRQETGIVVELSAAPPPGVKVIRPIADVLDDEAILTPDLFALCRWAADYYVTTLADVLAAALPGGLRASSARIVHLAASDSGAAQMRGLEATVVAHLATAGPTSVSALTRTLGDRRVTSVIRALAARGVEIGSVV
jgi:hypothetical protein